MPTFSRLAAVMSVLTLAWAGPVLAQSLSPVLTDAPVPSIMPAGVAPADRAGSRTALDAGPLNSTPFSGVPGSLSGGGSISPAERDRAGGTLPNLSK